MQQQQAKQIDRVDVPGSFELVYASRVAMEKGYDAVIAIGNVIRGETIQSYREHQHDQFVLPIVAAIFDGLPQKDDRLFHCSIGRRSVQNANLQHLGVSRKRYACCSDYSLPYYMLA